MPSATRTVVIARPPGEVFAFFTEPANERKWRRHLKEVGAEGPVAVGARVHQVVAGPGGRGIPADIEVTGYEPDARYAFRVVAGPVRPEGEFRFAATADGRTEVTMSLHAELTGVKKLLLTKPVQKSMGGETAGLDRAKELLETS
jgi:uncharacterized protein YndB with AHSA1/START domain